MRWLSLWYIAGMDPRNIHYMYVCSTDEIRQDMEDVIARMRPWYIKREI